MFCYYFIKFNDGEPIGSGYFRHTEEYPSPSNEMVEIIRVTVFEYFLSKFTNRNHRKRFAELLERHKKTLRHLKIKDGWYRVASN